MKFEKRKFTLVLSDVFAAVAVVVAQAPYLTYFGEHGGKFRELVSSFLSQDPPKASCFGSERKLCNSGHCRNLELMSLLAKARNSY